MTKAPYKFIDTSIFLEVFKKDIVTGQSLLSKATLGHRKSAAYWTIIEINKYFLIIAIDLHNKVLKLQSAPDAVAAASNGWGRSTNYTVLLQSLLMRSTVAAYHSDYKMYASQLESVIVDIHDRVIHMVSKFEGSFSHHPIVTSVIESRADFKNHVKIVNSTPITYDEVWKRHRKELELAKDYFEKLPPSPRTGELLAMEKQIKILVESVLTETEIKKIPKTSKRHTGDLIIGLSCPKGEEIIAHDESFNTIAPSLGKLNTYVDFASL